MTHQPVFRYIVAAILFALAGNAVAGGTWIADANGCKIWEPTPGKNETVTWSGACVNGYADGTGTLQSIVNGALFSTYDGNLAGGKQEGKGSTLYANGDRYEGSYVNGQFEGLGMIQYASGIRYEGSWKAGKYDGIGKITTRDKQVTESEFKAGNRVGPSRTSESPVWFDIRACAPSYSKDAMDAKEGGVARIQFDIGVDGKLLDIKLIQSTGFDDLDQATLSALSRCEFKPALKGFKPVASTFLIDYEWKPIPPKVPAIFAQLEGDQGVVVIDVRIINAKNLDHIEELRKQNGQDAREIKLRNLETNKKYSAKFKAGVGLFVVPEGKYCVDTFSEYFIVEGKPWESFMHWCQGESISVNKASINNAGEWWFARAENTDDPYHAPFKLFEVKEQSAATLRRAVFEHKDLLGN